MILSGSKLWNHLTKESSRQDYLRAFKNISPATASRELKVVVDDGIIEKYGDKRTAKYRYKLKTWNDMKKTDHEIDRMVYKLYGLTEEYIKIMKNFWTGIVLINEIMGFKNPFNLENPWNHGSDNGGQIEKNRIDLSLYRC